MRRRTDTDWPPAVWVGPVHLSLVSIPVKAYPAKRTGGGEISLYWLHRECLSRIENRKTCPIHGAVPNDEIVSGYEYRKGRYVVIDPAELDRLRSKKDEAVNIQALIRPDAVDARYYTDRTYYLLPDGAAGEKPYAVLRRVLADKGLYGIAQVVLFRREQVVLLRPLGELLVMTALNYDEQFRDPTLFESRLPKVRVSSRELALTSNLVDAFTREDFDYTVYRDPYGEKLMQVIEAKARGLELPLPREEESPPTLRFADALKQSLARAERPAVRQRPTRPKARRPARAG